MKFRKKPVVVEASRWFVNGDHPLDDPRLFQPTDGQKFISEGRIVRRYRDPTDDGKWNCEYCGNVMYLHGWIDTREGGHIVCPGDWIITGVKGEHYSCRSDIFEATYGPVEGER